MLAAVLSGKRRGTGLAGKQLSLGEHQGAEDVLTATVFERLSYLPESVLQAFFDRLLALNEPLGPLDDLEFWPSWSLDGQRVEPDVVLYGAERTMLVEAKRFDNSLQQYAQQLARELLAGYRQGELRRTVLLTIGGLQDYDQDTESLLSAQIDALLGDVSVEYELVCRSWHGVYVTLLAALEDAETDTRRGLQRLISDIAETYDWHGLRTTSQRWLAKLVPVNISAAVCPIHMLPRPPQVIEAQPSVLKHHRTLAELSAPCIGSGTYPISKWSFCS